MASYDDQKQAAVDAYLQGGGTQANVDAYFAGNPSQEQFTRDASAGGYINNDVEPSFGGYSDPGAGYYAAKDAPGRRDQASYDAELSSQGFIPGWQATVNRDDPLQGGSGTLGGGGGGAGSSGALGGGGAGGYGALGGGGAGGGYGALGGGGTGGGYGALAAPDGSASGLLDLQRQAVTGLQGLLGRDTTASRKAMQEALYKGQEEGINTAADRARAAMLEGTFGRGVGSSSILVELAGRGEQEHQDALARAQREAFTQAGAEDRADLASQLGLLQNAGALATTGIQGEANIRLADLARMQQESQFGRNLGFQGGENAANRAQSASQFSGNLALQQAQLAQQGSQFGQNLAFQGGENAANRAAQQALANQGYAFTGGENAANRAAQTALAQMGYDFTGGQNALTRDQQTNLAQMGYNFTGGENQANRDLTVSQNQANRDAQTALAQMGYNFTGDQAALQRDLQKYLNESSQTSTAQQNQLTRDQSMQQLLLNLANQQDIASSNRLGAGIGAGISGAGALLGPWLAQYIKGMGD